MEINIRFDADRRGNSDANSHRGGIFFVERIRLTNMLPAKVIVAINSVGTRRNHVSLSLTFRNTFSSNVLLNTRNIDTVSFNAFDDPTLLPWTRHRLLFIFVPRPGKSVRT